MFVDGRPFAPAQMQRLAREVNVAETVFLLPATGGGDVRVRIFTPLAELPFAGHPVLGTAFVVGAALGADAVTLETGAGLVPIALERDGDRIVFGWMRQPIPSWQPYERTAELLAALGAQRPGPLAIHLARHGRIGFGEQIEIRPGAEIGRPSVLYATVVGEGDRIDSVEVGGTALIVAEGRFRITPG